MKLLVFAHIPPPHHGQSYMVQLMLKNFGGDLRKRGNRVNPHYDCACYHVNARFSRSLENVGEFQGKKLMLVLFFCLQAIWCRFRYGVTNFYYIPAPGKHVALYRDWLVMFLCRPFFKRVILHWHAAGLAKWLETSVQIRTRSLTYHWFKQADLSMVISNYNIADAEKLRPRRIRVVANGIPDPVPDFITSLQPRREARLRVRRRLLAGENPAAEDLRLAGANPEVVRVLFIAHGSREKGLFAAAQAVGVANAILSAEKSPLRLKLVAAGVFVSELEEQEFGALTQMPELAGAVDHLGFVSGAEKSRALREADLFCFPTVYMGENQPVNLIEAMAFGLPIVTTRWRSLPEMLPPNYPGLVDNQEPGQIAAKLLGLINSEAGAGLRENFKNHFMLEHHLRTLSRALHEVEAAEIIAKT